MNSLFDNLNGEGCNEVTPQRSSHPETLVVQGARIQAEEPGVTNSFFQLVQIVEHVGAPTLLVAFDDNHTS